MVNKLEESFLICYRIDYNRQRDLSAI